MFKRSTMLGALVLTALQAGAAYSQDLFPPVAAVVAPADNSYLNFLPSLSGTAFDNVAVQDVQARIMRLADGYSWNGALWTAGESWLTSTVVSSGVASWSYSAAPSWLNGASYSVSARALDTSSNWSTVYSTSVFHYDAAAPASAVTVPPNGQAVSTFTAISGTAWDNESFTAQIWVKVRRAADSQYWNGATSQWTAAEAWNLAVGSFTWTYTGLPQAALASGATYFAVSRASDLAGNIQAAEVSGSTFVYSGAVDDVVAPAVAITQPFSIYIASLPQIAGTAADNVAVASVTVSIFREADGYYWDGTVWAVSQTWLTALSSGGAWVSFQVPAWVNASTYTITARALDNSGNWSTYATSSFIIDGVPPSAAVLTPANGSRHISLPQISGTVSYDESVSTAMVRIYDLALNKYWMDGAGSCGGTPLPGWVSSGCPGFPEIWNVAVASPPAGAIRAWTYDSSALGAGLVWPNRDNGLRVEVKAGDLAGNYFVAASTFSYDDIRPYSRVTYPANGVAYSSMTAISGTSYDLTSAVSDVRLRMWYLEDGTSYYWQPGLPHWIPSDTGWWSVAGSAGPRDTTLSWSYTNADFSNPGSANYVWQEGTHDGQQGKTFNIVTKAVDAATNTETVFSTRAFVYSTSSGLDHIEFITPQRRLVAGTTVQYADYASGTTTSTVITVALKDSNGNLITSSDTVRLRFSSTRDTAYAGLDPAAVVQSSNPAWQQIKNAPLEVNVPAGQSSASIYMWDTVAGSSTLTVNAYSYASGANLTSIYQYQYITPAPAAFFTLEHTWTVENPRTLSSVPFAIPLKVWDQFGNLATGDYANGQYYTGKVHMSVSTGTQSYLRDYANSTTYYFFQPDDQGQRMLGVFSDFVGLQHLSVTDADDPAIYGHTGDDRVLPVASSADVPFLGIIVTPRDISPENPLPPEKSGLGVTRTAIYSGDGMTPAAPAAIPVLRLTMQTWPAHGFYLESIKVKSVGTLNFPDIVELELYADSSGAGQVGVFDGETELGGAPVDVLVSSATWDPSLPGWIFSDLFPRAATDVLVGASPRHFFIAARASTWAAVPGSFALAMSSAGFVAASSYGPVVASNNFPFNTSSAPVVQRPYSLPGCSSAVAVRQDGAGNYTSIQGAVDGIGHNLGGDTCVVVRDTGTYSEQVTVQGFTNNGYRLKLMADPELGAAATVSPPAGSTAAFRLLNDNVSVLGLNISPAGPVDYGVLASSAGAEISSVTLVSSDIRAAGVRLSSHSLVAYSTISVPSATGVQLTGSSNTVTYSALTGGTTWHYGLHFIGGDYNTVSRVSAHGATGSGALMEGGADYNTIADSVFTSSAATEYALYVKFSRYNQITRGRFTHPNGHGAYLSSGADYNTVSDSTMTGSSVYYPLLIANADHNVVERCVMTNTSGFAAYLVTWAAHNTISDSVMISNGVNPALRMNQTLYNTVTRSLIANAAGPGAQLTSGASMNTVSFTTVTANSSGMAFNIDNSTGNLLANVFVSNPSGYGAFLGYGADANTISSSTLLSGAAAYFGLKLVSSSSNTVENSLVSNPAGVAYTSVFGSHNAVRRSTVTSAGWPYYAAFVDASHYNSLENSVVRGANALMVRDSSGTAVAYSVLAATNAAGAALRADTNHGLSVAGSALSAHGSGIKLNAGNGGNITLSSLTVSGPVYGLEIEPLAAGAVLTADSLAFTGQPAASRGVSLLGGTLVSTFTAFSFGTGTAFNADSSLLAAESRITMRGASGTRYGTPYENDPAGYVDWDPDYVPPPDPEISSAAISGVGAASLTVNWGATFSTGTVYHVRLTTLAAAAPFVGAGTTTAPSYAFSGLDPDTRYYGFVSTAAAAGYMQSGAARTLAAAPSAASFSAVSYSSASLAWTASNPAWTAYEYSISASSSFAVIAASAAAAAQTGWLGGLDQGATYYGRVRAVNADGIPTAYAYTAAAQMQVLLPSGLPSAVSGAALGVSSINWTWNAGAMQNADIFTLREGGLLLATAPFAASGVYVQAGLAPNTTHALRVSGLNSFGEGPATQAAAVYTLAAVPAGLAVSQVGALGARLDWGLNGNPPGTTVQLWRSPDDETYAAVYEGPALYHADTALEACTPYYYKARARNGAGLYTAFGGTLNFSTQASTPAAPGALYAEALDGARLTLGWEFSPSPGVTAYALYYDNASGTVDYAAPYAVFSSTVSSWTTPALASGSAYRFALRAVNRCGVEEQNTVLVSAQAAGVLSGVRAAIKTPQTGKKLKGNSVTVVAEIILGLPSQIGQVRFQYRPQGGAAWTDIAAANPNHPNPDTAAPYFVHWDADAMAAGTYELRALATDVYSADDPAPPVITVIIDPVDYDTHERVSGGELQKEQKISNAVTSTVQAADESTALVTKLVIPAGAVSMDTVAVTMVSNPASKPVPPSGSEELSLAVKINLSNGQSLLSAGKTAAVTLSYKDDNGDGIVDGTGASVDRLRMFTAPDGGGAWTEMPTTVDRAKKTISGTTGHFSFFSVFATPSASVGSVKAYPNPWQPGSGGRFDAAGVTLSGLPVAAHIRIYTLLGELVRALDVTAADAGTKVWDGRNTEGSKAASGVYIVFVKSGSDEKTLKLAVER